MAERGELEILELTVVGREAPREEIMTSAERMAAIVRGERPDRIPILPFTGGFCAQIVGCPIRTIYDDPERSFWAQVWTQELLGYDGGPSLWYASYGGWEFGGEIKMPHSELEQAPVVSRFPVQTAEQVEALQIPDVETAGYLPLHIEFAKIQQQLGMGVTVPAWGPFTAAANMVGVDVLCRWMIKLPEVAHALLSKVAIFAKKVIDHFVDLFSGHPLSGSGGCATSSNQIISPRQFEDFVLPYHSEVYGHLSGKGVKTVFCHICGDQTQNLTYWAQVPFGKRGILSFGHEVDPTRAMEVFGERHIVAGNVEPRLIAEGTWLDVYESARACIDKAKYAPGGYVLMAGCDIPPSSPPFNIYALKKAVMDFGFYD
jgi:uroporphyrinogen decarboxylase